MGRDEKTFNLLVLRLQNRPCPISDCRHHRRGPGEVRVQGLHREKTTAARGEEATRTRRAFKKRGAGERKENPEHSLTSERRSGRMTQTTNLNHVFS